jgi:PilZ domain
MSMHYIPRTQERRRAQRFRVRLPVELKGEIAMTRDLSACGVFFVTARSFVPGECLRFTLVLEHIAPGCQVRLQCQGRVVRVEPGSGGAGVAADITGYRLDSQICACRGGKGNMGDGGARA